DAMENYVLEHRIRGDQWAADEPWAFHGRPSSDEGQGHEYSGAPGPPEASSLDIDRRKLIAALRPFVEHMRRQSTVKQSVAALFEVITSLPVRQTLTAWIDSANIAGQFELAAEHAQAWADLTQLFDELVE